MRDTAIFNLNSNAETLSNNGEIVLDKDMNPIYNLGLGDPFATRLQHIGYEEESIFNVDIPIKGYKVAYPSNLDPYYITYSKRGLNNVFEAINLIKIK